MFSKYGYKHLDNGLNEVDGKSPPGGAGSPQIDLAIISLADHAVLHCPSSFSNVAKRLRLHNDPWPLPTSFWCAVFAHRPFSPCGCPS